MRLRLQLQKTKIGRVLSVIGLTALLVSCGVSAKRDVSLQGAKELFKKRLMTNQSSEEEKQSQQDTALRVQADNMKNRRRLLQVRIPEGFDGAGMGPLDVLSASGMSNVSSQQNYVRSKQALEVKQRALKINQDGLAKSDQEFAKVNALAEQEYLFDIEKILLGEISRLETDIKAAEQSLVIGSKSQALADASILFGRNRLAAQDELVDLQKSFFFVGGDVVTGVSLGRVNGLDGIVKSRQLSANFNGLTLPAALKSLSKSIDLSVYLSPDLRQSSEKVFLNVMRSDVLDIIDILIDTYDIALAYDRDMGIARFYTQAEFNKRLKSAIAFASAHNEQALIYQNIQSMKKQRQQIFELYSRYFNKPGEEARLSSIEAQLILDEALTIEVPQVLVQLKELAIRRQKELTVGQVQADNQRQLLLDEIFTLKQEIELLEIVMANAEAGFAASRQMVSATPETSPAAAKNMPNGSATMSPAVTGRRLIELERQRVSVIRDPSLATNQPIYTESFTIFYQNSDDIKSALNTYFDQIYPADRPLPETSNGGSLAARNLGRAPAIQAENAANNGENGGAPTGNAGPRAPDISLTPLADNRLRDQDFQPPKIESNKTSIILTGLKTDIDLAHQLIDDLDIPAKQVLVEVFMVNVTRNWQRKLEVQIESVLGAIRAEGRAVEFISNVAQQSLNNRISIMPDEGGSVNALIDFMEVNNIGRTISSPTILAKDRVAANINRTVTRFREVRNQVPTGTLNADGIPVTSTEVTYEPVEASLNLTVTPTINVLNDHVTLEINFEDSSFIGEDANSPQLSNNITTTLNAAPGDVIVLAGLYKESNKRNRETLPGLSGVPFLGPLLGGSVDDQLQSDELVIFLAPTVITPQTGIVPANAVR
ncbi:MAG: type II secretion system protein GspD [Parvibaculales bacterium]